MIKKNIIFIFLIFVFLWIMFITTTPVIPNRLPKKFPLCDVMTADWQDAENQAYSVFADFRSISDPVSNSVTFIYKNPSARHDINCKSTIPDTTLYHALSFNIVFEINQEAEIGFGIHRVGQGPTWNPPIIVKSTDINKPITVSLLFTKTDIPKFNWLSGDYEKVGITITKFDPAKELIFTVHEIYLL